MHPAQPTTTRQLGPLRTACAGFGLGLRTPHYGDFLAAPQAVDWLEIITDNFLVEGGKPLVMLDTIRRDYPMAMHGVAMSIGAAGGLDTVYLRKVKALADRVQPLWVSDHLCWTGPGPEQLHDLYPLPYTDEAAHLVVTHIRQAQDLLQRQLVLENVSSYIDFQHDAASEWQFLAYIAQTADCKLLVDVNNIFVSSVNHRFDPLDYLRGLPAERVQQIHLAGHTDHGTYLVDTHDHPVTDAVWNLYAHACQQFGPVATMIERDDHIPPLPTLLDELAVARSLAHMAFANTKPVPQPHRESAMPTWCPDLAVATGATGEAPSLTQLQRSLGDFILERTTPATEAAPVHTQVRQVPGVDTTQRLGIYHHAYRARLAEVLADSFTKTNLYMGSDTFAQDATAFAVHHPPLARSLNRYGAGFAAFLARQYPDNPELFELAQLDWDLRTRFDTPDAPALTPQTAQLPGATQAPPWLTATAPLHPSLLLRSVTTNVATLWRAIDTDDNVPQVQHHAQPQWLAIWRKGLQPHFQSLDPTEATFLTHLLAGNTIDDTASRLGGTPQLPHPEQLGGWLQRWLADGLLHAMEPLGTTTLC